MWTLIQREILTNLMTFRFFVAVVACVALVLATTVVLTNDYARRLANYNAAVTKHSQRNFSAKTYSYQSLWLDRAPNPLSIFSQGLDKRAANTLKLARGRVPHLWEDNYFSTDYDNPFRHLLAELDIVAIFQLLLSLLALVFAYDAIAGEREAGTLRLMLANPVSRGTILFSKYVGAMVCLLLPFLLSFLLALLCQMLIGVIQWTVDDYLRIGGIFATSLVYVSTFYLIGLLISSATRHAATSLILSVFVWIVFTLIYPNVSLFMVNRLIKTEEKVEQANRKIEQLWEHFHRERKKQHNPLEGRNPLVHSSGWHGTDAGKNCTYIAPEFEPQIPAVKAYYQSVVTRRIQTAEKTWRERKQVLADTYIRKSNIARNALRFSPAGLYQLTTEAWAGTGLRGVEDFFTHMRHYRQTVLNYFDDKKAFSSRQWFASDRGEVRWDDMPRCSYRRPRAVENATQALPDLLLLVVLNPLLFLATFLIFIKKEM